MDPDPQIPIPRSLSEWISLCDLIGRYVPHNDAAPHIVAIGALVVPHIQAAWAAIQAQAAAEAAATPSVSGSVN